MMARGGKSAICSHVITVLVSLDRYSTCTAGKHWVFFGENPEEHACFRGMHAIVLGLAMAMHGFSCFNLS
jgi:hypothetical protein